MSTFGAMLVYLNTPSAGTILEATEPFREELTVAGPAVEDHNMPCADGPGLWLFEGWVEVGPHPDPDVSFVGEWRRLTHWEMCRLRHGLSALPEVGGGK